jgi:hypothetical protein
MGSLSAARRRAESGDPPAELALALEGGGSAELAAASAESAAWFICAPIIVWATLDLLGP